MNRSLQRRLGVLTTVVGLAVAAAATLPSTAARFSAQTRNPDASSFEAGEFGPLDGLEPLVCAAAPDAPVCAPEAGESAAEPVPVWLAPGEEPGPAPVPAPTIASAPRRAARPSSAPSPRGDDLPESGEDCRAPECAQEAVHVVGAFAEHLRELREAEPDEVPAQAVETIAEFAAELRELPEPPREDLPLPEETVAALEQLVQAGVLEPFAPECVTTVGQLAALVREDVVEGEAGPSPSPSPSPSCAAEAGPEQGQASPTPAPEPGAEPQPAPTGEASAQPYPYDGPGHRVRRVESED